MVVAESLGTQGIGALVALGSGKRQVRVCPLRPVSFAIFLSYRVLGFRLLQEGDVGVGVFPKR
jgi:hypothetical protein